MQVSPPIEPQQHSPFKGFLPFFWLALACIFGVIFADAARFPTWVWGVGTLISILVWILTLILPVSLPLTHYLRKWTRADQRLPGAIVLLVFFLGGWRYAASQPKITPNHTAYYNDRGIVQIVGQVIQPPDYRDHTTNLIIQVESLLPLSDDQPNIPQEKLSGLVLLQVQPGSEWSYGYRVRVTGLLQTPLESGDFSYSDYLARQGIFSLMPYARIDWIEFDQGNPIKAIIHNLSAKAHQTLQNVFPSPEADLLAGILLGRDQGLSPDLQEAFRRTGTTHIIAISGFNIAILAGLFSSISTRILGRKWGALIAIVAISGYTLLVGGNAAVVRAAIMGTLGVLGGMFGRRQNGLNSLGIAATGMILITPNVLWDIGFQLSIAATLGLVLYAQPLEQKFVHFASRKMPEDQAQKMVGPVSEFFLFTLAAQAMTLPITAYHFGGISWIALIANPLILPVQSLVMILGGLTLLAGLLLPGLGQFLAMIAIPFVSYTINMVSWLARFPGANLVLPDFHALWLVLFYVLLFVVTLFPREQQTIIFRKVYSHQAIQMLLVGMVIFTWNRILTTPDDMLHLTLLDSAGTILIQAPGGNTVLIGGGPRPSHLNQSLGEMLPAGDQTLNAIIVGSTARDDLNGLTGALRKYSVEMALWGIDPNTNQTSAAVYSLLSEKGIPRERLTAGQVLNIGSDIRISVLWTGDRGAVLWLEWKNFSALLPTGKVEEHWLNTPEPPDVLLLKDGLKAIDLPIRQMNLWSPSVILLPLEKTSYPLQSNDELMAALSEYPVVTNLEHGWIRISTDGENLWVHGER